MESTELEVIVLVKAAPVLTRQFEETMCVAGCLVGDNGPAWVRLHPVPFRDLDDESKFAKYQRVQVEAIRPKADRRPESWVPIHGSIRLGETLGTDEGWARRRRIVEPLDEAVMCDLVEQNRSGSAPGTPSLAVVRPVERPTLDISKRSDEQIEKWRRRAVGASSKLSLFDDATVEKPEFEVVPWRFRYAYRCSAASCKGHFQTIVDWEILALWRHVRHDADWQDKMRLKFENTLWDGKDTVLFVGNQEQHPTAFLVLGVFWPPAGGSQQMMDL